VKYSPLHSILSKRQ